MYESVKKEQGLLSRNAVENKMSSKGKSPVNSMNKSKPQIKHLKNSDELFSNKKWGDLNSHIIQLFDHAREKKKIPKHRSTRRRQQENETEENLREQQEGRLQELAPAFFRLEYQFLRNIQENEEGNCHGFTLSGDIVSAEPQDLLSIYEEAINILQSKPEEWQTYLNQYQGKRVAVFISNGVIWHSGILEDDGTMLHFLINVGVVRSNIGMQDTAGYRIRLNLPEDLQKLLIITKVSEINSNIRGIMGTMYNKLKENEIDNLIITAEKVGIVIKNGKVDDLEDTYNLIHVVIDAFEDTLDMARSLNRNGEEDGAGPDADTLVERYNKTLQDYAPLIQIYERVLPIASDIMEREYNGGAGYDSTAIQMPEGTEETLSSGIEDFSSKKMDKFSDDFEPDSETPSSLSEEEEARKNTTVSERVESNQNGSDQDDFFPEDFDSTGEESEFSEDFDIDSESGN